MVKQDNAVHVELDNALYLRKCLLQTAIDSAQLIQNFNSFQKFGSMKKAKMVQLSKILEEIKNKGKELDRSKFPQLPVEQKVVTKKEIELDIIPKESSEIEKLKRELTEIENRLKTL